MGPLDHRTMIVGGAYDAISARLVEQAGFDAIWASGLCIAASKGISDSGVISVGERVDRIRDIARSTSLPLIVDCDNGNGSVDNALELVGGMYDANVAAISIEDSCLPKLNSLYPTTSRALEDIEVASEKIISIKRHFPAIEIIGRTEALIAGRPLSEAVERARSFLASGADYILIHTRAQSVDEFKNVATYWDGPPCLVAIPTLAEDLRFAEFERIGFKMVIYANQAMRASIYGIRKTLAAIKDSGAPSAALDFMETTEELLALTDSV